MEASKEVRSMEDIGKNIRALRVRKKLSQDQLAQILHVTRQTVSNYETGRSRRTWRCWRSLPGCWTPI